MNETSLNVERMKIYVLNIESIYKVYYWLSGCVKKRTAKGLAVSLEHLAKCTTAYKIAKMCAEVCRDMDGDTPTNEEKRAFRNELASMVINESKEI